MFEIQARFLYSHEKILLKMRVTMKKELFLDFSRKWKKWFSKKRKIFFF